MTYAPDEPELGDRLMAPAAGGTAWLGTWSFAIMREFWLFPRA